MIPYNNQQLLERLSGRGSTSVMPGSVRYNAQDPDQTMADITKRDQARYEQDYIPVEDQAISSLRNMSIIDDAKERVADGTSVERSRARATRDASRYGFRRTGAQIQSANREASLGKATGDASTLNEARINQFDRNRGFRNELINIGRGVSSQSAQGLSDAAGMQVSRENANRSAKAKAKASQTAMMGSLAATALMVAI